MRSASTRKSRTVAALGAAAVALTALVPLASPAAAAGNTMVVNVAAPFRPVTHVGSGGLYALATTTSPSPALLKPLRLNQLTQPAPGVQQLGNGATVPTGDVLKVAPSTVGAGAQSYVRMPDIYPNFPYRWVSWSDWNSKVTTMVNARLAATGTTNINGWELWNEPDWTWSTSAAGAFNDGWTRTFRQVRSLDAATPIVGPSYSHYDHAWMQAFLTAAKAAGTLPDVAVWHELDDAGWNNVDEHVADYRALETSLGIAPRPISINEYGSVNQADTPSVAAHFLAQFERTGIKDAERAYWYESGTIGGLIWNNQPTGSYWLYKWYGDMAGRMVGVTPSGDLDGLASYDSSRKIVDVVLGGTYGNNAVRIDGIAGLGSSARVTVSSTPSSGRKTVVAAPTTLSTSTYTITNGSITVPITNQDYLGAYQVLVTPAAGPTTAYQQVYEAENATVVNAQTRAASGASNGYYVGGIDGSTSAQLDSLVDFVVNVPTARTYTLQVRYANGLTTTSTHGLAQNGSAWRTLSYPPTGAWAQFGTVSTTVPLNAGYNVVRLAKGSPQLTAGTGYAELDSITLS